MTFLLTVSAVVTQADSSTTVPTCCGRTCPAILRSPDITAAQQTSITNSFTAAYGTHVHVLGVSTRLYNCHAWVFAGSGVWINDPSPFLGPKAPCYKSVKGNTGTVYRWGTTTHSARKESGYGLPYKGKCGTCPLSYHDNAVYGRPGWMWAPV